MLDRLGGLSAHDATFRTRIGEAIDCLGDARAQP